MSAPFRSGNHRALGEGRFSQHALCPRGGIRFSTGFKSLETLRHAVFGKRMTLETMMLSLAGRPLEAIETLRRAQPSRAEHLDRVTAILRAYPVLLKIAPEDAMRDALAAFLGQLAPRRAALWRKEKERLFGMSFYDHPRRTAYVLTYAHRRFYLWRLRGHDMDDPHGWWEIRQINGHLFHSDEVGRLLVERAAPKRNPVSLPRVVCGLPDYLRREAQVVSCFRGFDPVRHVAIVRNKIVGPDRNLFGAGGGHGPMRTTPAWFVHAFMGHEVRGNMIMVPLVPLVTGAGSNQAKLDAQGTAYRAVPPSIVISPESQHMFRLFTQPKCWTRYRPESERTQYVREHAGYRVDAATMESVREMQQLTRHPNELVRMNRDEMDILLRSYATKDDLGISLHVLVKMEAQAGQ